MRENSILLGVIIADNATQTEVQRESAPALELSVIQSFANLSRRTGSR
jgi:hypothetical protein